MDDTTFETLWHYISKPLVKLGIPQQDIDELKEGPLSSEEESYIKKLKVWKELEEDLLSTLNDLEIGIRNVGNQVLSVENQVVNVENQVVNVGSQVLNVENQVVNVENQVVNVGKQVLNVENQVVNVENQVVELRKMVEKPVPSQVDQLAKFDFTGKIDGLCKKFQDGNKTMVFSEDVKLVW